MAQETDYGESASFIYRRLGVADLFRQESFASPVPVSRRAGCFAAPASVISGTFTNHPRHRGLNNHANKISQACNTKPHFIVIILPVRINATFPRYAAIVKIALITETYPPEVNGVAMTLQRLVQELVSRGHCLQVIRVRQGQDDRPNHSQNLNEILLPGRALPRYPDLRLGLPAGKQLRRLWMQDPPDIVHIATEGPLGCSALWTARRKKIPVSSSFHTNFHSYGKHYGLGMFRRAALWSLRFFHNQTRITLAPTKETCLFLLRAGFQRPGILGRGVDTRLFAVEKRRSSLRKEWLNGGSGPVVAYVGRLAEEKNLTLAVRAFEAMKTINPGCRFVLVGDGPMRSRLQKKHPHFHFCGSLKGEELAAHYASADVFLFPSRTETFGNVITEAMASGLAVIAFDRAAAREHIRHGENGLTVADGDEEGFIKMASTLAKYHSRCAEMRTAARETAETLRWEDVAVDFENTLQALLSTEAQAETRHAIP